MIEVKDLNYSVGGKTILKDINLFLGKGEKIGIVGVNGAGKTTLLKLVAGQLGHEYGSIKVNGTYSYLSQEIHKDIDYRFNDSLITIGEYLILDQNLDVQEWQINKLLNKLNMEEKDSESILLKLSGGQKIKIELIKVLLNAPDVLILDEPTNFLDVPSAQWLMKHLTNYPKSVLVVSHDLRLMNKTLSKIWFLNEMTKSVEVYKGDYDEFLKYKAIQDKSIIRTIRNMDKYSKQLERSAQQLAGRKSEKEARKASRRFEKVKEIKREIELKEKKLTKSKRIKILLPTPLRSARVVLKVSNICKKYCNKTVLRDINMEIERGEKVVVVGKNGVGKTTLFKILANKIKQTSGQYKWGSNVIVGYYAQEYEDLDYNKTVLENVKVLKMTVNWVDQYWRNFLGRFLISGDMINQRVKTLSGGEKTRLALAKLFSQNVNVLLLDEPTTYLDFQSQEVLLNVLREYKGTVVIVSHEPNFVKGLNVNKVLLMPEEKYVYYDEKYLNRVGLM
jgi:ATP-binding cassette, subfamily F, member 3